jgi:hypothetical protein
MRELTPQELPTSYPEAAGPSRVSKFAEQLIGLLTGRERQAKDASEDNSFDDLDDSELDDLELDE